METSLDIRQLRACPFSSVARFSSSSAAPPKFHFDPQDAAVDRQFTQAKLVLQGLAQHRCRLIEQIEQPLGTSPKRTLSAMKAGALRWFAA